MGNDLWNAVLDLISKHVSKPTFDTWFETSKATKEGERWIIESQNEFAKDWLEHQYTPLIKEAIYEITKEVPEVVYTVEKKNDNNIEYIVSQVRHLRSMEKAKLFHLLKEEFPLYFHDFDKHSDTTNSNEMKSYLQNKNLEAKNKHAHSNRIDRLEMEIELLKGQVHELNNK